MKYDKDKISVIIPIYNSEKYLKDCIDSIINQSYNNLEILLVDNNSSDNSLNICKEFEKKDNRIIVLQEKRKGVSYARNKGIGKATGEYIMFIDSDDYVDLKLLEKLIYIYNKYPIELVQFEFNESFRKNKIYKSGIYDKKIFINRIIKNEKINAPFNKLYLSKIIKENNLKFDEKISIGEDLLFNIKYFKYVKKIYYSNQVLYYYRLNNESITNSYMDNRLEQLIKVNDEIMKICTECLWEVKFIRFKNILSSIKYWKKYHMEKTIITKNIKELKKNNVKLLLFNNSLMNICLFVVFYIVPAKLIYVII